MVEKEKEKREEVLARERQVRNDALIEWSKQLTYSKWIEKGANLNPLLQSRLKTKHSGLFEKLYDIIGESFCISGSWVTKEIALITNLINPTMEVQGGLVGYDALQLVANDIDVHYGSTQDGGPLEICFHTCQYERIEGIESEINTIQCNNWSAQKLLRNNDINATDAAVMVTMMDSGIKSTLFVGGSF